MAAHAGCHLLAPLRRLQRARTPPTGRSPHHGGCAAALRPCAVHTHRRATKGCHYLRRRAHPNGTGDDRAVLDEHATQHLVQREADGLEPLRQVVRRGGARARKARQALVEPAPADWTPAGHTENVASTSSPATGGRPGVLHSGWFRRAPSTAGAAFTVGGVGTDTRWLTVQHGEVVPWFVRTAEDADFSQVLGATQRRVQRPGKPLVPPPGVLVADGPAPHHAASRAAVDLLSTGMQQ